MSNGAKNYTSNTDLASRLDVLEHRVSKMETLVTELRRALYGYDGETGIIARLSNLEEKMADIKKLAWVILGIVAGILIAQVASLILISP